MRTYFLILTFTILLVSSCKKNNITNSANFPNEIGNHWQYKYTTYGQGVSYINVDIIGQTTLPNGQNAKVWLYQILNYTDTLLVTSNNDSVIIYNNYCSLCPNPILYVRMKYFFPLQVGNIWFSNVLWGDTTKVINNNSLTVPVGTFKNTFELYRKIGYSANNKTNNNIWFTPNVGLTKLNQSEYNLGPVLGNGLWELSSYNLK